MAWTTPRTWGAGEIVTKAIMDTHVRDNLNAIAQWTSYTPTWAGTGGSPSVGNGTLTGKYRSYGNVCELRVALIWGSTTTANTATSWTFTLPVTASGLTAVAGVARLSDTSAISNVPAVVSLATTTTAILNAVAGTFVGATTPFTWANTDQLVFQFTYEI